MGKVKPADLEPDTEPPESIKELVIGALTDDDIRRGESIDQLMERIYSHIESKALEVYHSNAPWALRRWALENILKDEIVSQASCDIADGLIGPVIDWQKEQSFDPLKHYEHRLSKTLRRSPDTVRAYMITAARFVSRMGRKARYSDDEVMIYIDWASEHFSKQSSYVHELHRLQQFLRSLPPISENKDRKLPIDIPNMPEEFNQPMWSDDEVETIAWACVLDKVKPDMVIRIAVASIYGGRRGELGQLSSADIHLDGNESYIYLKTEKKGIRKRQPIPPSLIPLFQPHIEACSKPNLHNKLKRIVERAEVPWPPWSGFHSFRRNVVTLLDQISLSDIAKHKFMRWSVPRHLGMLDRYKRIPTEVSDSAILEQHPRVKMWERILPFLLEFNPHYKSQIDILT